MSTHTPYALLVAFGLICFIAAAGCNQRTQEPAETPTVTGNDEYDPHDVPITEEQKAELREQTASFADAVAMMKLFRDEIEQETAAGIPENPFRVHQALDKADLVLQRLAEIARDSDVPKEHWEAVNTSANDLRTLLEQVHQNIDNKQDPNFAAVADEIDQKLAGLEQIAAGQTPGAETSD
jgi:hypothetical protein